MKAAFLCDGGIEKVYSSATVEELCRLFEMDTVVYTRDRAAELGDAECLFSTWGMPGFTEEEIAHFFPKLKVLFYGAGSVQRFARPFLNRGVQVISAWMANSVPVIEYTVAQIILANKGFFQAQRMCKSPAERDDAIRYFATFPGNYDTPVGLIGLGAIGAGVALRLKDYQLKVYAHDPFASAEKAQTLGVELVGIEELFECCQTISNHVANLPETVGMLNADIFSRMRDNATFINTGRGAQVVEDDLIAALREKPGRTAVLDVTFPEPPVETSPLYTMENVILTPHMAGSHNLECKRMGRYMLEEAQRYLAGDALKYSVSLKMLETMA